MAQILNYKLDIAQNSPWVFHTASPSVRNSLLFVQEVGEFFAGPGYYTVREGFDSFLLKLTISGQGLLEYGGKQYSIPAGHFFWIDCQNHQNYCTDPDIGAWRVLWLHFYGGAARFYYEYFLSQTGGEPAGSLGKDAEAYDTLRGILELHRSDASQVDKDLLSAQLLTQLLTQLLQCNIKPVTSAHTPLIMERIQAYLTVNYQKNIPLAELGAKFGLSPCYLQRQFKQYYGQSPLEYLVFLRITRAKELLRTTEKPVSEIAYTVGFENPNYFSRLFKRSEALTPKEYRRLWPHMELHVSPIEQESRQRK